MVTAPVPSGSLTIADVLEAAFPVSGDSRHEDGATMEIHVIPQGTEPRWIIVGDSRKAAPVLRSWWPFKVSTRLKWAAVVGASSMNLLSRLPGTINRTERIDPAYWRQHLPGFTEDWTPVVHVGNRSHTRKAIVFFVGSAGTFEAVAKVPLVDGAAAAILNEAEILRVLLGKPSVPAPVFEDAATGIAAQTWLEGRVVSRELTTQHIDFLASLALENSPQRVSDRRELLVGYFDNADLPYDGRVIHRALAMMKYDFPLPGFIEHRDFAPWNLKKLPDGSTGAIDWEWAVRDGLPCQDIFRYFFIQDALFDGAGWCWQDINNNRFVQSYYRRFAIPGDALLPLVAHYLLRVLSVESATGNTRLADYAFEQLVKLV